jgi:hypothetical protein
MLPVPCTYDTPQRKLDELEVPVRMDYEVLDGMTKLERLGLITVTRGEDGHRRLQVRLL